MIEVTDIGLIIMSSTRERMTRRDLITVAHLDDEYSAGRTTH